jgi:hypothetical protein
MAFLTVWEAHPRLSAIFGGRLSSGAGQKDLAAAHHEGIFGAQRGFEPFALLLQQFSNQNWTFMEATIAHHTQSSLRMHLGRLSCHDTPKRSFVQPNLSLKP